MWVYLVFPTMSYSVEFKDIANKYADAVVFVKTDKGSGTGFFINEFGSLVTCYHVIDGAKEIRVKWKGELRRAQVIFIEKEIDQVILNIFEKNTPYIDIRPNDQVPMTEVEKLDSIMVMGYPLGMETMNINKGEISAIYQDEKLKYIYQSDVVINPGNSGGPAFDHEGMVIGVVTAKIDQTKLPNVSGMNFIYSIQILLSKYPLLFQSNFLHAEQFQDAVFCKIPYADAYVRGIIEIPLKISRYAHGCTIDSEFDFIHIHVLTIYDLIYFCDTAECYKREIVHLKDSMRNAHNHLNAMRQRVMS